MIREKNLNLSEKIQSELQEMKNMFVQGYVIQ
jgi:hypothetical protein